MSNETKSAKVNALIAYAAELGLEATVEANWLNNGDADPMFDTYTVTFQRKQIDPQNAYDQYLNGRRVQVYASRYIADGKARAFALHAQTWSTYTEVTPIRPTQIRGALHTMAYSD